MTLVAGSYERFIWGFSLKPSAPETLTLKTLFSYPAHTAPIKCVTVAGPVAASGGADDAVRLYDLPARSELGALLDHGGGSVSALALVASPAAPSVPRNLLSGADDGALRIYDADPFVLLRAVPAHRRAVSSLAVHPSGRLALTVGRDACLAMVNLVRGRKSFSCRLDREASIVRYGSEGGERFFMVAEERVTVHDSEDARIVHELDGRKRVLCVEPGEGGLLFTGGEDQSITAWDIASGKVAYCIDDAHSARVKGLVVFKKRGDSQASEASNCIASASSDGVIRIWDVRMTSKEKPNPLAEASTESRITCLAGSSMKYCTP